MPTTQMRRRGSKSRRGKGIKMRSLLGAASSASGTSEKGIDVCHSSLSITNSYQDQQDGVSW